MKITFIGGGNMAAALIGGLKKKGFSAAGIQVVEPSAEARARLTDDLGIRCASAVDAAALNCEVIVLAVKPQQMREALAPLAGRLASQLVISVAAGLRIADMSRWLDGYANLVRTMPNTPALIGSGVTGLCAAPGVDAEGRAAAGKILGAVGRTVWIDDEAQMDAVTAVSGSGPGYVFYLMEALADAAADLGFPPEVARLLVVDTFLGAARLADDSAEPLAQLRERVTSQGGTTAAALQSFDEAGLRAAIARGVQAANTRGRELGDLMGKN